MIAFLSLSFAHAQETKKEMPLKNILEKIASQHHIYFNYIEDEIVVFSLPEPSEKNSLKEKLEYIIKETNLRFKVINGKYYNISNNKNLDKPLCGFIYDLETKEPIYDANVRILETYIGLTTDLKGYFELPTISPNKIQLSHINYEVLEISPEEIYTTSCPKLYLKPKTIVLNEVVTQLYLTRGISKKTDGTITIKPKQIGHLPGLTEPDVFKTMQQIPGIISVDESISNINVRGGSHDQNLVLWNGIRLFQTGHFFGMISALNPNLAHTIKIAKNGSSAIYGESISSVVDISTHSDEIEKTKGAIGVNWINADFYTKLKLSKKSNLEISGRRSLTDAVKNSPTYKNYKNRIFQNTEVTNTIDNQNTKYTSKENFYFYDFTAQYHQKIGSKTDVFLDLITISNQLDLDQSKIENITTVSRKSYLQQNTYGGNFQLKTNWNSKNTLDANIYASIYNIDSENESIESNQIFNQLNEIVDIGLKLQNNYKVNDLWTLKLGYQFNEIGIKNQDEINSPLFYRKIKEVVKNHAGILETEYISKNNKLKTTLGARANYFQELSTFILEPRLALNYKLFRTISLEVLGETKNQITSQIIDLQNDFLGIEKRRWVLANNTSIPIQKSQQASISLTYKENNWLLILDNFYKKVNGITSMSQGFQNQLEFENINGSYTTIGSEILLQKQINNFTTWISYSFNNNEYNFPTYTTTTFPNNYEIKHTYNIATIYDNKKLKIALGAKYHTGKPTTNLVNENPDLSNPTNPKIIYKSPNSENLKDYFQMNFSVGYVFHAEDKFSLNMGLGFENLTNQRTVINQFYRVNQNNNTIEKVSTYSLERTLNAFMRLSF